MLDKIFKRFDNKREVKTTVKQYGVYTSKDVEAVYNDSIERYEIGTPLGRNLNISTVDSFIDFIREELSRIGKETGKFATVTINEKGGYFTADDDFKSITCHYDRSLTTGWKVIQHVANMEMNHEELLTTLQKLRPFIENFEDLYLTLLDIRTIGRSEMISNPVFVAGDECVASSGYKITYKLQSGTQEDVTLPNHFEVVLPYSRGRQDILYKVPVELMFLNNGSGRLRILFQISELEQIEEDALKEEVEYLKDKLAVFKDLLVLLNY